MIGNEVWLALFPATYVIHFVEEFFASDGYPAYLYRLRGVRLTNRRFVILQMAGFILFVAAGLISYYLHFPQLMIAVLSGFVLCNGISHTVTAIFDGRYGPGLIASILLWIPLGSFSIYFLIGQMSNLRLAAGVATGLAMNGAVAIFTYRGCRFK